MVINQFKKLLLSLVLLTQMGTILPMAPAQEQGILSALASDAVSLVKGAAYCVAATAQKLGDGYLVARNNPKTTLALAVGVPLAVWGFKDWHYRNYVNPRIPGQASFFASWKIKRWPSAASLEKNRSEALVSFGSEFAHVNPQGKIAGLNHEIGQLSVRMKALEEKYLVCNAPFGITLYDIKQEFQSALKQHACGSAEETLSSDQFLKVNDQVEKTICSKILPYFMFSINYREAARLWWKLKVKQLRLTAMLHYIVPVAAGRANDPNTQYVHNYNQASLNVTSSHTPL